MLLQGPEALYLAQLFNATAMLLVIDTYNVLHTQGVLPPEIAGVGTRGLIELIGRSRYRNKRAILVCDGRPPDGAPQGRVGPVTVQYAGRLAADDLIVALVHKSTSPRRLTVVTSDRAIVREARKRRCETISSADFLQRLADDYAAVVAPGKTQPANRPPAPKRPQPPVLPPGLIAEAESMERSLAKELSTPSRVEPEQADKAGGPAGPREVEPAEPRHTKRGVRDDGDLLSPEVLAEAERLWRAGLAD